MRTLCEGKHRAKKVKGRYSRITLVADAELRLVVDRHHERAIILDVGQVLALSRRFILVVDRAVGGTESRCEGRAAFIYSPTYSACEKKSHLL